MAENTAARLHCLLKERIENPVPDQISGTAFGKGTFLDDVRPPSLFIPKRDAGFTPYNCAKPARRYVPELLFFLARIQRVGAEEEVRQR